MSEHNPPNEDELEEWYRYYGCGNPHPGRYGLVVRRCIDEINQLRAEIERLTDIRGSLENRLSSRIRASTGYRKLGHHEGTVNLAEQTKTD